MSHLLVLGEGWLGGAVIRAARSRTGVSSVDPPLDPVLAPRDAAARAGMRRLVTSSGATAIVNACGLANGEGAALQDANVEFPRWLCETIGDLGVPLVHIGSASEYGDPGSPAPVDEAAPARPAGAYATTKAAGTEVVLAARSSGLDATVARVFNVVGHPVPAASPLHQWISDLRALGPDGGDVAVWWPATVRDFVAIDDVAESLVDLALLGERPELVNVCSGTGLAYGDIVRALAARLGVEARVRSLDRPGIEAVVGDPSLLVRLTGTAPTMDLERLAATALPHLTRPTPRSDTADGAPPPVGGDERATR